MKLDHIPQIDGLRAIAVLSVIFYHLNSNWLPGGFYGVDIFFVISGFLITSYIRSELEAGTFTLSNFYARRIRRLLPAFMVVLTAVLITGYFILPADRYERLGYVSLASMFSVSNFFFWQESGYFDVEASIKPLLHTWSLAVEEQFYFFWPLVLLLLSKSGTNVIRIGLIILFTLSLCFVFALGSKDTSAVFYLLPGRVFELIMGASLVYLPLQTPKRESFQQLYFVLGFFLITISVFLFEADNFNTAIFAILPCFGASLIIYSRNTVLGNLLLANRIMTGIGKISYSLYLIHWPLLVYLNYTDNGPSGISQIILYIIATFILAYLLYSLIEKPIHKKTGWMSSLKINNASYIMIPSIVTILAMSISVIISSGFISRYPNDLAILQKQINAGSSDRERAAKCMSEGSCSKKGVTHKVLVLGDSYSKGAAIALNEAFPKADITLLHLGGCKPLKGDGSKQWLRDVGGTNGDCAKFLEKVFNSDFSKFNTIVFALRWANRHLKYIDDTVDLLGTKVDDLIVIGPRLVMRKKASEILAQSDSLTQFAEKSNAAVNQKQYNWGNSNLRKLLNQKSATYIDAGNLQGGVSFNNLTAKGEIYIYDDGHLTIQGARDLGLKIKQIYPKLFTNK